MKKHGLGFFIGFLALVLGGLSFVFGARQSGKLEAHVDLLQGESIIRTYGNPRWWQDRYGEIILKEYNVKLVKVGSCTVSETTRERADGYNEVSRAAIESRIGKGVLERAWHQAEQEWEASYAEQNK